MKRSMIIGSLALLFVAGGGYTGSKMHARGYS
jgi:hypothetical protein